MRELKPSLKSRGYPIPSGQGGPPAGSESCVAQGRPWLRSVDSEQMSRVIEPRKPDDREGRRSRRSGRQHRRRCDGHGVIDLAGVRERGASARASQEPGRSRRLLGDEPSVGAAPQPSRRGASSDPAKYEDASEVSPSEGNEARRDGRREVGASRRTYEGGEPRRRDPLEGRARRGMELL